MAANEKFLEKCFYMLNQLSWNLYSMYTLLKFSVPMKYFLAVLFIK